jgi:hypothetical protein
MPTGGGFNRAGSGVTKHSLLEDLLVGNDHTQYQLLSKKDAPSGYCGLDAAGLIAISVLDMSSTAPPAVAEPAGASAGGGLTAKPAWDDHIHEHGVLTGGTHHAVAVAGVSNGFLSSVDKTKLDGLAKLHAASHVTGLDQIGTFAAGARGLVPAPAIGGGDATKVLLGDATWAVPVTAIHASSHAVGQSDVVTPLAIGASYLLFTQTESISVITGAEGTLLGTGVGSVTLPANFFTVGKTIRIQAAGYYTRAAGSLQVNLYLQGTSILATDVLSPASATARGWAFDALVTCRSTGAPGTVMGQGQLGLSTSAVARTVWQLVNTGAAINVTTTGTLAVNLTALWSNAGQDMTCTNFVLTAVN